MLDLTALEARFRNLSLFGCKAAGGKVPLFYRDGWVGWKKTLGSRRVRKEPEVQGPAELRSRLSIFVKAMKSG